ncbi:hypothetical protein G3O08_20490 [Cryomorpha ignava]|uniref:Toxin-antitoxin system YwqK family antitoxin n=1 Tax=Cryomorpha ignava TaxID=101383 RepID=A0A7K3WW60_9FLAO|nr:hypothetical protein [Cryomorpha ignava]NEN25873.1 hypothetical protein [Cryomorpha ignava]
MTKKILLFIFTLSNLSAVCQHELDAAESCILKIEKQLDEVLIAYGSRECTKFTIDTLNEDLLLNDYTLLVFDKEYKSNLIYQITVISGEKEGVEISYINNEKVFVNYVNGIKTGKSRTFYPSGNVHFEREYKKGILRPKVKEFDKEGNLLKTIKIK